VARGTVLSLHRFPVKSMAGEAPITLALGEHGAEGDRRHALWLRGGRRLSARAAPRVLAWRATLNGALRVTAPDGRTFGWDDDLERALTDDLGRDVALVRDPRGMPDAYPVHVTFEASRRRLEEELGRPIDVRRFRPNVHVDLPALEPFAEAETADGARRMVLGAAELRIADKTDRCAITINDPDTLEQSPDVLRHLNEEHASLFGLWAEVVRPGEVRVGDPVELLP
jgi:uncharacterized protein YcbX